MSKDLDGFKRLQELPVNQKWLKVVSYVRSRSDEIRTKVIPLLLTEEVGSQSAYWRLYEAEKGPEQHLSFAFRPVDANIESCIRLFRDYPEEMNSNLRQRILSIGLPHGLLHVIPQFLAEICQDLFSAIDSIEIEDEEDFIQKISLIYFALKLSHLPVDLSGRTNEDFIVYLSHKWGYPLTFSGDGYRGSLYESELVSLQNMQIYLFESLLYSFAIHRGHGGKEAYIDFDSTPMNEWIYKNLETEEYRASGGSKNCLTSELGKDMYECIAANVHLLINALNDDESFDLLMRLHPDFRSVYPVFRACLKKTYHVYPIRNSTATSCDTVVSETLIYRYGLVSLPSSALVDMDCIPFSLRSRVLSEIHNVMRSHLQMDQ